MFLLCPNPALNGVIVQAEGKQQCKQFESGIIRDADWFLHNSSIHLRYRFEEWMDFLLGWIKHFYIPDLRYCRYDWLPNYEWLFSKTDPKDTRQRDREFGILKETLQMECKGWPHIRGDTRRMSFWEKLNALGTWMARVMWRANQPDSAREEHRGIYGFHVPSVGAARFENASRARRQSAQW